MEEPQTPTRETPSSKRQDTPIADNDADKTPPKAPRLIRTGPIAKTQAPPLDEDDDDDALFSKERPNESPTLKHNRRKLEATHIDPRYLDRPIARPMGPRPAPEAPQRLKRQRHSEPAGGVASTVQERDQRTSGARALVGPRPLVKSPRVGGRQINDPFGISKASPRFTATIPMHTGTDKEDSDCPTPKASRLNKKRALSKEGDDDNIYDA